MTTKRFDPDLALAALTLVPLVLIASAFQAGLLKHRWNEIVRDPLREPRRRMYSIGIAYSMLIAAVSAEIMALVELTFKTNEPDTYIFATALLVTLGLGVALLRVLTDALVCGHFPDGHFDRGDSIFEDVPCNWRRLLKWRVIPDSKTAG